jgi:NitT/TauT family transport system permease protein
MNNKNKFFNYLFLALPLFMATIALLIHWFLPDIEKNVPSNCYTVFLVSITGLYLFLMIMPGIKKHTQLKIQYYIPLITFILALFGIWDLLTLKSQIAPLPYFPHPEKTIYAFIQDGTYLLVAMGYSIRLELMGYLIGATAGLISGVLIGWSERGNYWLGPVIKIIGPIPSAVYIPLALTILPNSFVASVFMVALAVWFPVTVLSSSGIANVSKSYYEVAKTLGADNRYLVTHIALPAAGPMIFMSLYAGLGTSFAALVGAELLGAKTGLGFYITWHQGWGEYYKAYASIFILSLISFLAIYGVLKVKDKLLVWQKGLLRW